MNRLTSFLVLCTALVASTFFLTNSSQAATTFYVSPTGTNTTGFGSETKPYKTIAYALSKAKPGTTIVVKAGTYPEYLKTLVNGTAKAPITLKAQGNVVITGNAKYARVMDLLHDYYHISGFEFKGRGVSLRLYESDGNRIEHNYFHHAREECIVVRNQSSNNFFSRNRIEYCGLEDFGGGGGGKNGEGIYIGTAPEQSKFDASNNNHVINNTIKTHGNECVDIKEGAHYNTVEFNDCSEQKDPNSGGFNSRGNYNIFRYNKSYNNVGSGIRVGGDTTNDGLHNQAYGNELINNKNFGIKAMRLPQGLICGNMHRNNTPGFTNQTSIHNPACPFPLLRAGVQ